MLLLQTAGGHGIVWDGGEQHLKALLDKMWAAGKVCYKEAVVAASAQC